MKTLWNKFTDLFSKTIIHPQYFLKAYEYEAILILKKKAKGIMVDIGCGRQIYKKELAGKVKKYIGVDHPNVSKKYTDKEIPDVLADALDLPFKKNYADTVSMISVLEHIPEPLAALKEASRVLKFSGVFVLVTVQNYPLHDSPYDFFRYTRFSLKKMLHEAGFQRVTVSPVGNFPIFWGQMLNVYLLNILKRGLSKGTLHKMLTAIFIFPVFGICLLSNLASLIFSGLSDYDKGAFAIYNIAVALKTRRK